MVPSTTPSSGGDEHTLLHTLSPQCRRHLASSLKSKLSLLRISGYATANTIQKTQETEMHVCCMVLVWSLSRNHLMLTSLTYMYHELIKMHKCDCLKS